MPLPLRLNRPCSGRTRRLLLTLLAGLAGVTAPAQVVKTVFEDDFSTDGINPARYVPDAPFFEGGQGDIAGTIANGVMEFAGTTTQQWWAGGTLRLVPTFTASEEQSVVFSVDRVAEAGQGTASRSALWIMNGTNSQTAQYVLFADVRGEGGWRYNRKIGEPGDVPTGGGTDMVAFNDPSFDDGALHRMKVIADGRNVRLFVDDILGAQVRFPFTNLVFHLGSYARANNDTASTTWDNLLVQTIGAATFSPSSLTLLNGQNGAVAVRIPAGANATNAVQLRVVSGNPGVADAAGATGGRLTVTFPAGGTNVLSVPINALQPGGSTFTLENDIGLSAGNSLSVVVIDGPGVKLEDGFDGATLDPARWTTSSVGFESGTGDFTIGPTNGVLGVAGVITAQYWGGASIVSQKSFTASPDLPLVVEVDRVSVDRTLSGGGESTAARTGVFLTTTNRGQYVFFGQNLGENGWQVNVTSTGGGTDLAAFNALDASTGLHRMKLVANGETVEVFLDGVSGGSFAFPVSAGLHVELGGYGRADFDEMRGEFDNLRVEALLPCIERTPAGLDLVQGGASDEVTVTVPRLLTTAQAATVTVTSQNPAVAVPDGGSGGSLALNFTAGGTTTRTFRVRGVAPGSTTFTLSSAPAACVAGPISVSVTPPPVTLFSDDFTAGISDANWAVDMLPLVDGGATFDSGIGATNGVVTSVVVAEFASWPGYGLLSRATYNASSNAPITFEVDRVSVGFQLVTGTDAKQRTGLWVTDAMRERFVFFSEFLTHDGTAGGWQHHRVTGAPDDTPLTGAGTIMPAFAAPGFNDRGLHRLRAVANGATVKLYLDGVFGAEVPFPVATGLTFGFGAYVLAATDVAIGTFDNATVLGVGAGAPTMTIAEQPDGRLVITWTGGGALQSSTALPTWTDVTPAPTSPATITPGTQPGGTFYRIRQ